jgi:hypothetical protein
MFLRNGNLRRRRRLPVKIAISVLALALVAAALLFWNRSDDGQDTGQVTVPVQREPESPVLDRSNPGEHSRERPPLPTLHERKAEQSVPVQPVQLDRRPFDPARESDSQYERRLRLITAFDRFREESGISDEKAQAVLALLYDFQGNARHLRKQYLDRTFRDEWEADYKSRENAHTLTLMEMDAEDTLKEMLTPEELRAWRRTMERAIVWGMLNWPYEPPLLVPADT